MCNNFHIIEWIPSESLFSSNRRIGMLVWRWRTNIHLIDLFYKNVNRIDCNHLFWPKMEKLQWIHITALQEIWKQIQSAWFIVLIISTRRRPYGITMRRWNIRFYFSAFPKSINYFSSKDYSLKPEKSEKCLSSDGENVELQDCIGSLNQMWIFQPKF